MDYISNLKKLIANVKSSDSKQTQLKSDSQRTQQDNIFSRAGLNISEEDWDINDNFKNADDNAFNVETLKLTADKDKKVLDEKEKLEQENELEQADKPKQSDKLILDENNAEKITKYLKSKIDTSTLPENANLNHCRLITNSKGEVNSISIKLTDENGNPIGNVEYDTNGKIKHLGQIIFSDDGQFKIDEKYYLADGRLMTSEDMGEEYNRVYNVDDIKTVLGIINGTDGTQEYNMLLDANSDGVIDIQDIKNISLNLYSDLSISDIKKLNLSSFNNDYYADINGKIDDSKQGGTGDCWLLASLNALSYTEKGRQIIEDAIEDNGDGTYTVNFPGVDTSITITDEEFQKIREEGRLSSGDDDVLLMEIATEKVMDLIKDGKIDAPDFLKNSAGDAETSITGGWLRDIIYLLTGDNAEYKSNPEEIDKILDDIKNNPEGYAAYMTFNLEESGESAIVKDVNGEDVKLVTNHAWSIKSVDGDTVTIVNPWDSSKSYTISREDFKKYISHVEYYELSEYEGKKECSKNFQYDENGNRFEIKEKRDENGNLISTTKETYDKDGSIITQTVSTYDKNGNVSEVVETKYDPYGFITEFSITENTYDNNGNITGSIKKIYDENGILISSEESEYDKNGNIIKNTTKRADGTVEKTIEAHYDSSNNITTKTIVEYDGNGEVISTTEEIYDENGGMESKTYNKNGKVIAERKVVKDSDGRTTSENGYTYDENGNTVTHEIVYYDNGKRVGSSVRTYDSQGKETKIEQYHADGTLDNTQEIEYDESSGGKKVTTKKYDKDGNVIETTVKIYDKDGNEIS